MQHAALLLRAPQVMLWSDPEHRRMKKALQDWCAPPGAWAARPQLQPPCAARACLAPAWRCNDGLTTGRR